MYENMPKKLALWECSNSKINEDFFSKLDATILEQEYKFYENFKSVSSELTEK